MKPETLNSAYYVLSDESNIPFYSTSNGYNDIETEVCENHFIKTIPFKDDTSWKESKAQAMAQLINIPKKWLQIEKLWDANKTFMKEYIDVGHMVE